MLSNILKYPTKGLEPNDRLINLKKELSNCKNTETRGNLIFLNGTNYAIFTSYYFSPQFAEFIDNRYRNIDKTSILSKLPIDMQDVLIRYLDVL